MPPLSAMSTEQEDVKMENNNDKNDDFDLSSVPNRPPQREVARAVANLGNTCYMNAVLQALAHAPELYMAMDVHGHRMRCPIYKENAKKMAARSAGSSASSSSRSSSPDNMNVNDHVKSVYSYSGMGTRKSSRRLNRSPTNNENEDSIENPNATKFCALCETEHHMERVHCNHTANSINSTNNKPVAPSDFVHGFIDEVAPETFRVGQQEDSHEFLRLLIEAMQKSCKQARPKSDATSNATHQGNPQDTPTEPVPSEEESESDAQGDCSHRNKSNYDLDSEYPFHLFSGKIESKVTCGYCHMTSSTLDPIEDIGLEVTPLAGSTASPSLGRRNTPSPVPTSSLADVSHALQRFACAEDLDAGYKCEKCGKVGRATKQMRLASIPPILTLHLKRFRYGTSDPKHIGNAGHGNGAGSGYLPTRRSQRSSEVSQLIATGGKTSTGGTDWYTSGKIGSAKIEGPSAFKAVMDLGPYLTEELQKKHGNMICRLFAVIVHVGKNSHSGHYLAYVRNMAKNEWWKMDDARVSLVSAQEVLSAEAYMLFYRVVDHPYSKKLAHQVKVLNDSRAEAVAKVKEEKKKKVAAAAIKQDNSTDDTQSKNDSCPSSNSVRSISGPAASVKKNPRKRKAPEFTCGEEWARTKTMIPETNISSFRTVENMVSKYITFTPEFQKLLSEHASKANANVGHGPSSGVSLQGDCDMGSTEDIKCTLLKCFLAVSKNEGASKFLTSSTPMATRSITASRGKVQSSSIHVVEPDDEFL